MAENSAARILEAFSACYDVARLIWDAQAGLPVDYSRLLDDPLYAVLFFTQYAHERRGTNPNFPRYHRVAIRTALGGDEFVHVILYDSDYPRRVWQKFVELSRKPNEKNTEGSVRQVLEELRRAGEPNLVKYLGNRPLFDARRELLDLRGIGENTSCFFLRDLWKYVRLWRDAPAEAQYCLQPVDEWLRRWAPMCWPEREWSRRHDDFGKEIVAYCHEDGVDPVDFNMGCWFVASHFQELCSFFNISESERDNNEVACLKRFKAGPVVNRIKALADTEGRVFTL